MKLDPEVKINELIAQVAALPRPNMDYTKMSPPDLAVIEFTHRMFEIQASYIALFRSFAVMYHYFHVVPEPVARYGGLPFEELVKWSQNYMRKHLVEVYTLYPSARLVRLLLNLKMEGAFVEHECERRLEHHKVGNEIILLLEGQDRLKEFEKILSVDKISSFHPREQSSDDIKQLAVASAWSAWDKLRDKYTEDPYKPPEFPLEMIPEEQEFWDNMMINRVWKNDRRAHLRQMIPIFAGETETIPQIVHSRLKEDWRKIKRRNEIFEGRAIDSALKRLDPERAERIDWSIIPEMSRKAVSQRLIEELHEERDQEREISARLESERAYRIAIKRWGKRGKLFLDALRQGKDVLNASSAAGVTRQTGHKYLSELKKLLSEKNSSK